MWVVPEYVRPVGRKVGSLDHANGEVGCKVFEYEEGTKEGNSSATAFVCVVETHPDEVDCEKGPERRNGSRTKGSWTGERGMSSRLVTLALTVT